MQSKGNPDAPLNMLWLGLWCFLLALGWLLPNHFPPWPNFHSDLWVALLLLVAGAAVVFKSRSVDWHWPALLVLALMGVPFLQFAAGLLPFAGQAWMPAAYLLGFLTALMIGAQWERQASGQAMNGLFLAIGAAAIGSMGIQLHQWLIAPSLTIWVLPSFAGRPHANFGQPNLLATFLIWGLLACAWGVSRRQIRWPTALFMSAFLTFGIALTQSRTALIAMVSLALASWFWRDFWKSRRVPWFVTGIALFLVGCLLSLDTINTSLLLDVELNNLIEKTRNDSRLKAYKLFLDAALQSPWWGYGWSELGRAQLAVADTHAGMNGFFFHSHNLFLELILWCGIPLGGCVIVLILFWIGMLIRRMNNAQDGLLVAFLCMVGFHAMTELPLHYASFLLPTGLVLGTLNQRLSAPVFTSSRPKLAVLWCVAALMLALLARDYFRVEANFYALRFERARISERPPLEAPEVVLLTHLRESIRLARMQPKPGMSEQDLQWVLDAAMAQPSEASLFTLVWALALNDRTAEAQKWALKTSRAVGPGVNAHLKDVWRYEAQRAPKLRSVNWPD